MDWLEKDRFEKDWLEEELKQALERKNPSPGFA